MRHTGVVRSRLKSAALHDPTIEIGYPFILLNGCLLGDILDCSIRVCYDAQLPWNLVTSERISTFEKRRGESRYQTVILVDEPCFRGVSMPRIVSDLCGGTS